jgi:hypothetical protein
VLAFLPAWLLLAGARAQPPLSGQVPAGLRQAYRDGRFSFHGRLAALANPVPFNAWLTPLYQADWVVYAKAPFGGPAQVLKYLARYTHRVAISNQRLLDISAGRVTFRYKDYADDHRQKTMTFVGGRVPAAFSAACVAARLCQDPALRLAGQSPPSSQPRLLPASVAGRGCRSDPDRTRGGRRSRPAVSLVRPGASRACSSAASTQLFGKPMPADQ